MDFDFSSDQYMLRDSVRRFLADQWGPKKLRSAAGRFDAGLWQGLCDLGLQTLLVPEQTGGAGLCLVDVALVFEEFGRALVPPPMVDTILASDAIVRFGSAQHRQSLLPQVAGGACRFAFAHHEPDTGHTAAELKMRAEKTAHGWRLHGQKILVPGAQDATHLLVSARPDDGPATLFLCAAAGAQTTVLPHRAIDPSYRLCQVSFNGASAELLGQAPDARALARLLETSAFAAAAQMAGISGAALDIAVAYAKQRSQFDRLIGSFQAVKHKCADMLVALEGARSSVYYASWAAAEDDPALPLAVSMAKATCGDACRLACNDSMQIHGGVGFTLEFDVHFFLRRGKLFEYLFGDASFHRERVATIVLDAGPAAVMAAPPMATATERGEHAVG